MSINTWCLLGLIAFTVFWALWFPSDRKPAPVEWPANRMFEVN
jgi:hypothetical protein